MVIYLEINYINMFPFPQIESIFYKVFFFLSVFFFQPPTTKYQVH